MQIFQVGVPAGIQSTVINFSNALLQSSVNSFGSVAMAGYTAANNILGFLYVSINAVTQACMSFTSQNYGVGKYKRMDKVLIDCLILSVIVGGVLGCGAYFGGSPILSIYTEDPEVIKAGLEILSITTVPYFLCGIMDLFSGSPEGHGIIHRPHDPVRHRNCRHKNSVDLWNIPIPQKSRHPLYFLSGFLDHYYHHAGDLLLLCEEKDLRTGS